MDEFNPKRCPLWFTNAIRIDAGYFAAVALRASYTGRADLLQWACDAVDTPATITELVTGQNIVPRVLYVEYPFGILVIFRGTTRDVQFMLQCVGAAVDVLFGGPKSVNAVWKAAATVVWNLLQPLLAGTTKHVAFIGHSYGASTALVTTAMALPSLVGRFGNAYVIGCPKTGNGPFADSVAPYVRRFENVADPVTLLPPPTMTRVLFDPLAIIPIARYVDYTHSGNAIHLNEDGVAMNGAWSDSIIRGAIQAIAEIVRRESIVDGPHKAGEYSRRLSTAMNVYPSGWRDGWKDFAALFTLDAELTALGVQ